MRWSLKYTLNHLFINVLYFLINSQWLTVEHCTAKPITIILLNVCSVQVVVVECGVHHELSPFHTNQDLQSMCCSYDELCWVQNNIFIFKPNVIGGFNKYSFETDLSAVCVAAPISRLRVQTVWVYSLRRWVWCQLQNKWEKVIIKAFLTNVVYLYKGCSTNSSENKVFDQ